MTTEPCKTCNGDGHVPGHWMPENCPACDGASEVNIYLPDDRVTGCLFVTALFLVCVATVGVLALYEMARAWWVA